MRLNLLTWLRQLDAANGDLLLQYDINNTWNCMCKQWFAVRTLWPSSKMSCSPHYCMPIHVVWRL